MRTAALLCFYFSLGALWAQSYSPTHPPQRPDPRLTPGASTNVPIAILLERGYSNRIHGGARHVTQAQHEAAFVRYFGRVPDQAGRQFEVDHLIPLCIGGSNDDKNLWPQPYDAKPWNAHLKDKVEVRMLQLLEREFKAAGAAAADQLRAQLQEEIARDWVAAYHKYIGDNR